MTRDRRDRAVERERANRQPLATFDPSTDAARRPRGERDRRAAAVPDRIDAQARERVRRDERHVRTDFDNRWRRSHAPSRTRHVHGKSRSSIWLSFSFGGPHWYTSWGRPWGYHYWRHHHWPYRYWSAFYYSPAWYWSPYWAPYHCSPWDVAYVRPFGRPVYYTTHYNTYSPTYVTQPAPVYNTAPLITPEPCPFTPRRAWEHIAENDATLALEAFACLARENPDDGLMHIGYAIANAMLGADESAVAIMREAVYVDVHSLLYVPADNRLDELMYHLLDHYAQQAADPARAADALFMIAALRTIQYDHAGAYFAVTEAISHGSTDDNTAMLRAMLAEQLSQEMLRTQ